MKSSLVVPTLFAAVACCAFAVPARADECNRLTYMTFSAPVALPGVSLPPGTYEFIHPDCSVHLLRVSSKDGKRIYGTFLTVPEDRLTPTGRSEVVLAEMPAGTPEAIKAWFYPDALTGDELIYPRAEAPKVASAAEQTVIATH